jgi:hypothetical protein
VVAKVHARRVVPRALSFDGARLVCDAERFGLALVDGLARAEISHPATERFARSKPSLPMLSIGGWPKLRRSIQERRRPRWRRSIATLSQPAHLPLPLAERTSLIDQLLATNVAEIKAA